MLDLFRAHWQQDPEASDGPPSETINYQPLDACLRRAWPVHLISEFRCFLTIRNTFNEVT